MSRRVLGDYLRDIPKYGTWESIMWVGHVSDQAHDTIIK